MHRKNSAYFTGTKIVQGERKNKLCLIFAEPQPIFIGFYPYKVVQGERKNNFI